MAITVEERENWNSSYRHGHQEKNKIKKNKKEPICAGLQSCKFVSLSTSIFDT